MNGKSADKFPAVDPAELTVTREAVHAYARVIGAWTKAKRRKRKHWWHASLRPSLYGLPTGVIYGPRDLEIELDLAASRLHVRTCSSCLSERLHGQSSAQLAVTLSNALLAADVDATNADKQMNFGFSFGDSSVHEPCFYVTDNPHIYLQELWSGLLSEGRKSLTTP